MTPRTPTPPSRCSDDTPRSRGESDEARAMSFAISVDTAAAVRALSRRAEVRGPVTAAAERGKLVAAPAPTSSPSVTVWREGDPVDERKKLASWCRHADAPVYVDGKRVDSPFPKDPNARLAR